MVLIKNLLNFSGHVGFLILVNDQYVFKIGKFGSLLTV